MLRTNIYAHTDATAPYPGYVSLNREEDGTLTLTVRSPGNEGKNQGEIQLSAMQLIELAERIRSQV